MRCRRGLSLGWLQHVLANEAPNLFAHRLGVHLHRLAHFLPALAIHALHLQLFHQGFERIFNLLRGQAHFAQHALGQPLRTCWLLRIF